MAEKKGEEKFEHLHPKWKDFGTTGHFTKKTDEVFHSKNIPKWIDNYFKENPNSDGIEITMKNQTSFTIKHFVMTSYIK